MPKIQKGTLASLLLVASIVYSLLTVGGFFIVDERGYLYLSRSIYERASLDCSPYFASFALAGKMAIPDCFLVRWPFVYSYYSFGFSLFALPFYSFLGAYGLQLLSTLSTLLTAVLVYHFSKSLWKDDEVAITSAALYLFCTFAVFYAVSMWYHSFITVSFFASMYSAMRVWERKWIPVFLVSSMFCLWAAYYMVLPLGMLAFYVAYTIPRKIDKVVVLFMLSLALILSWAYNSHVYSNPILAYFNYEIEGRLFYYNMQSAGDTTPLTSNPVYRMIFGLIAMLLCRECVPQELMPWAWCQKSVLESSPFLIAFIPGLLLLRKNGKTNRDFIFMLSVNIAYAAMIVYGKTNSFGSGNYSMRYLLPVIPLAVSVATGYIARHIKPLYLMGLILFSLAVSFEMPALYFGIEYRILVQLSLGAALFLLITWCALPAMKGDSQRAGEIYVQGLLILSIFLSVLINMNDVKVGNSYRSHAVMAAGALMERTPPGSVILLPRKLVYENVEVGGRIILYYVDRNQREYSIHYPSGNPSSDIARVLARYPGRQVYAVICDSEDELILSGFKKEHVDPIFGKEFKSDLYTVTP